MKIALKVLQELGVTLVLIASGLSLYVSLKAVLHFVLRGRPLRDFSVRRGTSYRSTFFGLQNFQRQEKIQ